jgi:hypothetical protein
MQKKFDRLFKNRMKSLEDYNKFLVCDYKAKKRHKKQARFLLKILYKINNPYINFIISPSLDEPTELKLWTQKEFNIALEIENKYKNK